MQIRSISIWLLSTIAAAVLGYYVVQKIQGQVGPITGRIGTVPNPNGNPRIAFSIRNTGRADLVNATFRVTYHPGEKNLDYQIKSADISEIGCSIKIMPKNTGFMKMYAEGHCPVWLAKRGLYITLELTSQSNPNIGYPEDPLPGFVYLQISGKDFRCTQRWNNLIFFPMADDNVVLCKNYH